MDETFLLSNIAPQVGDGFNRHCTPSSLFSSLSLPALSLSLFLSSRPFNYPIRSSDSSSIFIPLPFVPLASSLSTALFFLPLSFSSDHSIYLPIDHSLRQTGPISKTSLASSQTNSPTSTSSPSLSISRQSRPSTASGESSVLVPSLLLLIPSLLFFPFLLPSLASISPHSLFPQTSSTADRLKP
jgi:hypothetical protein